MQLYVILYYIPHYKKKIHWLQITRGVHLSRVLHIFVVLLQTLRYHHWYIPSTLITSITLILQQLHILHILHICIILLKTAVRNDLSCHLVAANLFNIHEDVCHRPSTWFVACFLPSLGPESKWDARGGTSSNSKSVRSTELMIRCNDCLSEGWNE